MANNTFVLGLNDSDYILTSAPPVISEDEITYDDVFTLELSNDSHTLTLNTPLVVDGETGDYNNLIHKPRINGVELIGNSTLEILGIQPAGNYPNSPLTDEDLEELLRDEI